MKGGLYKPYRFTFAIAQGWEGLCTVWCVLYGPSHHRHHTAHHIAQGWEGLHAEQTID